MKHLIHVKKSWEEKIMFEGREVAKWQNTHKCLLEDVDGLVKQEGVNPFMTYNPEVMAEKEEMNSMVHRS